MKENNFYEGFEGEPEIILSLNGPYAETVTAWVGYFDKVMNLIEPGPQGWQGILVHYHADTGFYEATWRDPNPAHTATMLRAVLSQLSGNDLKFATRFAELAERATMTGWLDLRVD